MYWTSNLDYDSLKCLIKCFEPIVCENDIDRVIPFIDNLVGLELKYKHVWGLLEDYGVNIVLLKDLVEEWCAESEVEFLIGSLEDLI